MNRKLGWSLKQVLREKTVLEELKENKNRLMEYYVIKQSLLSLSSAFSDYNCFILIKIFYS